MRWAAIPVIAGCAPFLTSACSRYSALTITPTVLSSKQLEIRTAYADDAGDTITIRGMVYRPLALSGGPNGHLHIVARFSDGRPDIIADTHWDRISSRGSRSARYAAKLPIADSIAVSQITVSHVQTTDMADALPSMKP